MIQYIESIILPYVEGKHKELKLSVDQPSLAIFDVLNRKCSENTRREQHPCKCTRELHRSITTYGSEHQQIGERVHAGEI